MSHHGALSHDLGSFRPFLTCSESKALKLQHHSSGVADTFESGFCTVCGMR